MDNTKQILEPLLIIVSVFLVTLAGFLVLILRYNKNRIRHIKDKQLFQQNLLSARLETQEQTFEHISQELHDNIGQQITALNFLLENQKIKHPVCKEDLDRASASLSQIAQQVQQLSHSLNNNWVAQHGLISSIKQELERLRANPVIDFEYTDHTETTLTLSTDKQIILFRVFQEILNNALKHSKASRITVSMENRSGFQLCITDNGKGFDVAQQMNTGKGMGLNNIVNRAQIIGFDCTISSQNNIGTSFLLKEIISL